MVQVNRDSRRNALSMFYYATVDTSSRCREEPIAIDGVARGPFSPWHDGRPIVSVPDRLVPAEELIGGSKIKGRRPIRNRADYTRFLSRANLRLLETNRRTKESRALTSQTVPPPKFPPITRTSDSCVPMTANALKMLVLV